MALANLSACSTMDGPCSTLHSFPGCSADESLHAYPNLAQHRSFAQPARTQHLFYNTGVVSRYQVGGIWCHAAR